MNGLNAMRELFGLHPMNEAGGADAGSGGAPAAAPAAPAAPAATPESSSLLGAEPAEAAPATEQAPAAEADKPADKPAEDDAAPVVPDEYAPFKVAEGMELDAEVMPDVQALFKELGLPQDKAQDTLNKLLAIQEKMMGTPEQQQERMEQQITRLNTELAEQCKALPDIGGEKFAESLRIASNVMRTFGTPELRQLITYTAVGSNPEFFKFMHAIGSKMAPDVFEHGGDAAIINQRPADVLFGSLFNK
ncbi:MAG: hypothetical protein ACRCTL_01780 [Pseudomonas sp.]